MVNIVHLLQNDLGHDTRVSNCRAVSGGCINQAFHVELESGEQFFIKTNSTDCGEMFAAEHTGLEALRSTHTVQVPAVVGTGTTDDVAYLILEWIEPGRATQKSWCQLGENLAALHRTERGNRFGFACDNFLGSTPQPNPWYEDWVPFFIQQRIEPQIRMAIDNGHEIAVKPSDLDKRIARLLNSDCRPSLIHGDLWSGNFMIGQNGTPWLIDPAPYLADREAEFGILTLFGGFDPLFFSAYQEAFPLDDGFECRLPVYQLYHYLNHLNLFGASYLSACQSILRQIG